MNYSEKEDKFYEAVKKLPKETKMEFLDTYDQISSELADYFNLSLKNYEQYERRICIARDFTDEEIAAFDASMVESKEDVEIMLDDIRDQASFFRASCEEEGIPVVFDIEAGSPDSDIQTICKEYANDIYDASLNDDQYIAFQSLLDRKHPERGNEFPETPPTDGPSDENDGPDF